MAEPRLTTSPETLRQYALLADGERGALIGPRGDVAFLCAPRWHDDAVFSDLLGGRGTYVVRPAGRRFTWGGSYEAGSLIWRSRWTTGAEVVESREALVFPGERRRLTLLRRVEAARGPTRVAVLLDCRAGFGAERMRLRRGDDGIWTGRTGALHLRWSGVPGGGAVDVARDGSTYLELDVAADEHHDLVLEVSDGAFDDDPPDPDRAWHLTEEAWRRAVPRGDDSLAPRDVAHSWAVLRGLTSRDGAMVAAATTSLPERAEQGRDYDYRYAWIRDQCFTGQAVAVAGGGGLLDSAVGFVRDRLLDDGPQLVPAYTTDGDPVPEQRPLDLPGYPGAPDVRAGNQVRGQFQLDAFGEALLLFSSADRLDALDAEGWKAAEVAADAIAQRYDEPDAGIWELAPRRWAHSRLACVAGLRSVAARRPDRSADWAGLADRILADVSQDSLHPDGRWQRAPDDPEVDASLLLPALRGAVPADDPRTVATWKAVVDELAWDGYVYRFRQQPGPLHEAEGAFLLCGFHLALTSHQQGDVRGALRWFERTRGALGPPGLFTEEFDVVQRQLRGNLPQAFVHALLIESAHTLTTDTAGSTHEQGF
ncbi:glycoside hydrolase family 15 protein [Nocardioides sp.]|uniref:glycoside hydrolase family 15 protein n=1 Tax=Nocardioides sp. TaxID=35761 RepID=UPI002F424B72